MAPCLRPDDYGLVRGGDELAGDPVGALGRAHRRGKIDQTQRQSRDLVNEDPPKAPQPRAVDARRIIALRLMGATGNQPYRDLSPARGISYLCYLSD